MLCSVLLTFHLCHIISSSVVVDKESQKGIYLTNYCPKMKHCAEGTHVLCMYYIADNKMGPRCSNPQNVSITPDLANQLLDVTNAIRSRIALGKETGIDDKPLPRGYGIFRLHWDNELATFAQVLANHCVLRHDLCRATTKFPDPGQAAGLARFSYPDWVPRTGGKSETGLTSAKLLYGTIQILKSWYGIKKEITPSLITDYPDWHTAENSRGRLYLEMIYGSATHMGCGISAYTTYIFYEKTTALTYNAVQIICNYSGRPRQGTSVYNTVPPSDTAVPLNPCGCPEGSQADEECLCEAIDKKSNNDLGQKNKTSCPNGKICDPSVVVLPIFTIEDAPPEKLITQESYANTSLRQSFDEDIIFQMMLNRKSNSNGRDQIVNKSQAKSNFKAVALEKKKSQAKTTGRQKSKQQIKIKNRYFDKKHAKLNNNKMGPKKTKKTSLFSQAVKFKLPESQLRNTLPITSKIKKTVVKDVVARKDFSNAKNLVEKYMIELNELQIPHHINKAVSDTRVSKNPIIHERNRHKNPTINFDEESNFKEPMLKINKREEITTPTHQYEPLKLKTTKSFATMIENKTFKNNVNLKKHLNQEFNIPKASKRGQSSKDIEKYKEKVSPNIELDTAEKNILAHKTFLDEFASKRNNLKEKADIVNKNSDDKLMALLDTLEQEVKHVELRKRDKLVFDEKIRKIYEKVVGKSVGLLDLNTNNPLDQLSNEKQEIADDAQDSYLFQTSTQLEDHFDWRSILNNRTDTNIAHVKSNLMGIKQRDVSYERQIKPYEFLEKDYNIDDRTPLRKKYVERNSIGGINELRPMLAQKRQHYSNDKTEYRSKIRDFEHKGRRNNVEYRWSKDDNGQRLRNKNHYLRKDDENDAYLSKERRRFYQAKLDNIERRLQLSNMRRKKGKLHMRSMKPDPRKSENQMDLYGRARFAHGY